MVMSIWNILDNLIIKPIILFFEILFSNAVLLISSPGLAIILLSLVMNIILLPLYRRADKIQEEENLMAAKLRDGVAHIKKTFKGDEAFMLLQTYYRQNNYKPTYALRGSLPLLLEVPFFLAAYRFISGMTLLNGLSFGPIQNLGAPDQLINLGSLTLNALPILMTIINILSGILYTKGAPTKAKVQIYAMAILFLIVLYQSPSALVLYWTMNNLFSLIKNILTKALVPLQERRRKAKKRISKDDKAPHPLLFLGPALYLSVLLGLLIPSAVISASPEEFINPHSAHSPGYYLLYTFTIACGFFLVWAGIFYAIGNARGKKLNAAVMGILAVGATINYMAFGRNLGNLGANLVYDEVVVYSTSQILLNFLVLGLVILFFLLIYKKKKIALRFTFLTAVSAIIIMSGINIFSIRSTLQGVPTEKETPEDISIPLSQEGENVIVLMLDRGISEFIPYIFHEKPELAEKFSGFTYYPNTLSYATHTNTAAPALYGGYEYTPEELNKRNQESLEEKHNEALKLMPTLFSQAGYEVSVLDPPYAGYRWTPDLSIFDNMKNVHAYNTKGHFTDSWPIATQMIESSWERNFFMHSFMKTAPLLLQLPLYNKGDYSQWNHALHKSATNDNAVRAMARSYGLHTTFLNSYLVLDNLDTMTQVQSEKKNTFLMMSNETPHEPNLLQKPDYVPQVEVDNYAIDRASEPLVVNGKELVLDTKTKLHHYHINMATMLKIGEWFEYLQAEGLYDNSRILLVADHAYWLNLSGDSRLEDEVDISAYNPLLMVKDFHSDTFQVDYNFMTNADVPVLATHGLVPSINPFTGKSLVTNAKDQPIRVLESNHWQTSSNNGNTFKPDRWYEITGDFKNKDNWKFIGVH